MMATYTESALPRKRVATYGKAVRKHLPSYDHTISDSSRAPGRSAHSNDSDDFETAGLKSPSPPRPKIDIFDFPASDDEAQEIPQKKKRKLGAISASRDDGQPGATKSPLKRSGASSKRPDEKAEVKLPKKTNKLLLVKQRPKPPIDSPEAKPSTKTLPSPMHISKATSLPSPPKLIEKKLGSPVKRADKQPRHPTSASNILPTKRFTTPEHQVERGTVIQELSERRATAKTSRSPGFLGVHASSSKVEASERIAGQPKTPVRSIRDESVDVPSPVVLTPKGQQMWDGLLGDTDPVVPSHSRRNALQASAVIRERKDFHSNKPRRRLIDTLTEQSTRRIYPDFDTDDLLGHPLQAQPAAETRQSPREKIINEDDSGEARIINSSGLAAVIAQKSQVTGPKVTYGSQRSILTEDISSQDIFDMPLEAPTSPDPGRRRRGSVSNLNQLPTYEDDSEDRTKGTIRSVHELRQAGATNRLVDEVEDILDRVGRPGTGPSSSRRSGLMDLFQRMRSKDFSRLFRDQACEQRLFVQLGKESDTISGCLIVILLLQLLPEGSTLQTIALLRQQGIIKLLSRLLDLSQSVQSIAKARSSNMSRMSQSSLHTHEKNALLLPAWDEAKPKVVTPRTLALKCLEIIVRKLRESGDTGDFISDDLLVKLFNILQPQPGDDEEPEAEFEERSIDFELALSTLESHSVRGIGSFDEALWIRHYLPVVSSTLLNLLRGDDKQSQRLQILALRLTLNVTNNNLEASERAATQELTKLMSRTVADNFKALSGSLEEEDRAITVDRLILTLGVLINFAEWCPASRQHLQPDAGADVRNELDRLLDVFLEKQETTAEAESVEEVMENVAFGYLSVFLGYLALSPAIEKHIRERQRTKTLRPLLNSIEEFIHHNKRVDEALDASEDGRNAQAGLTNRLERMVQELRMRRS